MATSLEKLIGPDGATFEVLDTAGVASVELDGSTAVLVAPAANVADPDAVTATGTAVAVDLTFSSNAPTPSATQTISNGSSMSAAEAGQFAANVEVFMAATVVDIAALVADVTELQAQLEAALQALKAAGIMTADS